MKWLDEVNASYSVEVAISFAEDIPMDQILEIVNISHYQTNILENK